MSIPGRIKLSIYRGRPGLTGPTGPTHQSMVLVSETATPAQASAAIQTLLPEQAVASPAGMGRDVLMPARELRVPPTPLSTMQSVDGPSSGSAILRLDATGLVNGQEYAVLDVLADSRSARGIRAQGVITRLVIDGDRQAVEAALGVTKDTPTSGYPIVHGYRAVGNVKRAHVMEHVTVANTLGHGIYLGEGADQGSGFRGRAEGCRGTAWVINGASDVKLVAPGGNGSGRLQPDDPTSLLIENAAPEILTGDFWPEDTARLDKYTAAIRRCNGVVMTGATIAGPTLIKGRNAQGTSVRFGNTFHVLTAMTHKYKKRTGDGTVGVVPLNWWVRLEDADNVVMYAPVFEPDPDATLAEHPQYLISIGTEAGQQIRSGYLRIYSGAHMMESGRWNANVGGGEMLPKFPCRTHISDKPKAVTIDGCVLGEPKVVPAWAVNNPDPAMQFYVPMSRPGLPTIVQKLQHPLAYLAATVDRGPGGAGPAGTHGTLDDGQPQVTLDEFPVVSSNYLWALPARL